MSRFTASNYNSTRWNFFNDSNYTYSVPLHITDLSTSHRYRLPNVFGKVVIEQVSDNSFLIYENNVMGHKVKRIKFDSGSLVETFSKSCSKGQLLSLTRDLILIGYHGVYSITEDRIVKNWTYPLDVQMSSEFIDGSTFISCRKELSSTCTNNKLSDYIVFLLCCSEADILTMVPLAFSTLRWKYIPLSESFSLEDLISEDSRYKKIVDSHLEDFVGLFLPTIQKDIASYYQKEFMQ